MNKTSRFITITASLVLAVSFIGWRVHASRIRSHPQFEVIKDPSGSTTDGCETVVGLAERVLYSPGVTAKSTLTVLLVGDSESAYEPRMLASYPIPFTTKAIEGPEVQLRRQHELLDDLYSKCQATHRTDISPIFLAVKQAVADLHGKGCASRSGCRLDVDTDLEENVEMGIKNRLNSPRATNAWMPNMIDNSNIEVSFCGLAATKGRTTDSVGRTVHDFGMRDSAREERLKTTWQSLFSSPDLVTFQPYCPAATDMARVSGAEQQGAKN